MTRYLHALAAALFGTVVGAVLVVAPASAHTTATAEPATAGAQNAVISFYAAAESTSAGITSLKIVLPAGIAPADVTFVDGPAGWALQPDADGYVVAGPAVPVARDVQHRVKVRQLPLVPALVFKVLQTYSDGKVDRWIEVPSGANANPENPAPVVQLAAPPGGFPAGAASTVPSPAATDHGAADDVASALASNRATDRPKDDDNAPPAWILWVAAITLAVVGLGYTYLRSKSRPKS